MVIFGQKPWVNLFVKMSIFRLFERFVFIAWKGVFFVLEYRKRHFPCLYGLKKKFKKNGNFWTITMGQPPLKNINFSTFWTSCFYSVERRFFVLEYPERHFPCLCCLKRRVGIMVIFGQKPWVNPFVKMSIFRLF